MTMKNNCTYKEFGKYLRTIANLYAKYGDEPLERGKEYTHLHEQLCQLHNDFDHGAADIERLKDVFVTQCEAYENGWIPPEQHSIE